eukprot:3599064-Lingulodinium_polyedra.AAC.1
MTSPFDKSALVLLPKAVFGAAVPHVGTFGAFCCASIRGRCADTIVSVARARLRARSFLQPTAPRAGAGVVASGPRVLCCAR